MGRQSSTGGEDFSQLSLAEPSFLIPRIQNTPQSKVDGPLVARRRDGLPGNERGKSGPEE